MNTITLKMFDELNQVNVERTIDISNVMVPNDKAPLDFEHDIIGTNSQIEMKLNKWISERGNDQHDTLLTLVSWKINYSSEIKTVGYFKTLELANNKIAELNRSKLDGDFSEFQAIEKNGVFIVKVKINHSKELKAELDNLFN